MNDVVEGGVPAADKPKAINDINILSMDFENGMLKVGLDMNKDGVSSMKIYLDPIELIKEGVAKVFSK